MLGHGEPFAAVWVANVRVAQAPFDQVKVCQQVEHEWSMRLARQGRWSVKCVLFACPENGHGSECVCVDGREHRQPTHTMQCKRVDLPYFGLNCR